MATVTAVLLNWKRPRNMPLIVESLRQQSVPVDVVLINSEGGSEETFGVEKVVRVPWNAGPVIRVVFASLVQSEWVLLQDDDLMIGNPVGVEQALQVAEAHPGGIVGIFGRGLQRDYPHYWPEVYHGEAAVVKTRFLVLRRELMERVRMPGNGAMFADDLWLSLEVGRGEPVHWVDSYIRQFVVELPKGDVGLELRPEHYENRHQFCKEYMEANGLW